MFSLLFFQCISCHNGIDRTLDSESFPLCRLCAKSLAEAPTLCSLCGSPLCVLNSPRSDDSDRNCLHPWRTRLGITSYSARYLLLGQGFNVLKKWKITGGRLFDHRILTYTPSLLRVWESFQPDAVLPIPQTFRRAWKMRGSRALRIARWVSHATGAPLWDGLQIQLKSNLRQAERDVIGRLQNRMEFRVNSNWNKTAFPRRVILVDDFMTTGRTVEIAARTLRNAGVESVHCFCLGIRVQRRLSNSEPSFQAASEASEALLHKDRDSLREMSSRFADESGAKSPRDEKSDLHEPQWEVQDSSESGLKRTKSKAPLFLVPTADSRERRW